MKTIDLALSLWPRRCGYRIIKEGNNIIAELSSARDIIKLIKYYHNNYGMLSRDGH